MKISVITLHTVSNYGSVLQTYATQKVFEKLGHKAEFVDYYRNDNTIEGKVNACIGYSFLNKYKGIWGKCAMGRYAARCLATSMVKREAKPMQKFLKKYINLTTKSYYSYDELLADSPDADVYVTGSDQVWNSWWNQGIEKPYFLEYAPEGTRRIAFAASIGKSAWDEDEKEITREMLKKYSYISMREKSGVELLKELGIESSLILDPTLMLNGEEWKKIAAEIKNKKKYLLIYKINTVNEGFYEYAKNLADKMNWEIIRISFGYPSRKRVGKGVVCPDVETFLGYIDSAACVLTNSFHGTAFSLNLGTDFISVLPDRFSTRLTSILELTETEHRCLKDYNDFDIVNKKIDHDKVQRILQEEREKGMEFLKKALS